VGKLAEFRKKFGIIKRLSSRELMNIRRHQDGIARVCEAKRAIIRTMSSMVEPVAKQCVDGGEKHQRDFVLNTLMLLQTLLDLACSMTMKQFDAINRNDAIDCLSTTQLKACEKKSFDNFLLFWESNEIEPSVTKLVNGAVCQ